MDLQDAIDIEICERCEMLDIGVFAPNEILGVDMAKEFVCSFKSALEKARAD